MEYNKTEVYGKLFAGNQEYWIVSPHPEILDNLWDDLMERAFFGVGCDQMRWGPKETEQQNQYVYPVPFAIIVSGTWHIELRPPVGDGCIWCEKPSLLEESAAPENGNGYEDLELVGDLFRRDSYRDLDLDFEEEYEDAELEEEEALVEEG